MVRREAMASEEIEKVALQNAELYSQSGAGGMQRLNYIESLRRDTAMAKQVSRSSW